MLSHIPSSKPWFFEMVKVALKLRCCEYAILKGLFLGAQKLESHILYSEEMKSGLAPTSVSDEALSLHIHKSSSFLKFWFLFSKIRPVMTAPVSGVD